MPYRRVSFPLVLMIAWLTGGYASQFPFGAPDSIAADPLVPLELRLPAYKPKRQMPLEPASGDTAVEQKPEPLSSLLWFRITLPLQSRMIPPSVGTSLCIPLGQWF